MEEDARITCFLSAWSQRSLMAQNRSTKAQKVCFFLSVLKKAFDKVVRKMLWEVLPNYKVSSHLRPPQMKNSITGE